MVKLWGIFGPSHCPGKGRGVWLLRCTSPGFEKCVLGSHLSPTFSKMEALEVLVLSRFFLGKLGNVSDPTPPMIGWS